MSEQQPIQLGTVTFTGKDIGGRESKFDRISIDCQGNLFVLSVIDDGMAIKAIRSILNSGAKASIQAAGVKVRRPGAEDWDCRSPGFVRAMPEGYNGYIHKLGFGQAHALFVARTAGFMPVVNEESLWHQLNDNRFTTPILRSWCDHIREQLIKNDLLEMCLSHRCQCGVLRATTSDLDAIVEQGLRSRQIEIPDTRVIDVEYKEVTA